MRQPHVSHFGASLAIAHSNESKVYEAPPILTEKALSYSLPQVSHVSIVHGLTWREMIARGARAPNGSLRAGLQRLSRSGR